jgi:hypothetical protein
VERIELLSQSSEKEYEHFLTQCRDALFYHSLKFRDVIRNFIKATDHYFVACEGGEIIGALPSFLKENSRYGNIINSLPFYGSHGAILAKSSAEEDRIRKKLLGAFNSFAREKRCLLANIISSPFEKNPSFYLREWQPEYTDERIAQITELPHCSSFPKNELENELDKLIDSVRKRNVRKALKSGISLKSSSEPPDIAPLYQIHKENLIALKGIVKPRVFFQRVIDIMDAGRDYQIYYAEREGEIIAGLLVFYYKNIVEYYTPAIKLQYRNLQPLSFLIYRAMLDAIKKGYRYFNFGGTWKSQESLYQFKKRWGTKDYPYFYYIKAYGDISHLKKLSRETILQEYPWFYVLPFSELED